MTRFQTQVSLLQGVQASAILLTKKKKHLVWKEISVSDIQPVSCGCQAMPRAHTIVASITGLPQIRFPG